MGVEPVERDDEPNDVKDSPNDLHNTDGGYHAILLVIYKIFSFEPLIWYQMQFVYGDGGTL